MTRGSWTNQGEDGRITGRARRPDDMRTKRFGVAIAAVAALTMAVACGDDDDDDGGAADTEAPAAAHRRPGRDRGTRRDRGAGRHRGTGWDRRRWRGRVRDRCEQHPRRQRLAGRDDLRRQGRVARQRPGQRGHRDLQERRTDRPDHRPAEPDLAGRQRDHRQPVRPRAAQPGHRGGDRPGHRRRRRRPGRHGRGCLRRQQRPGRLRTARRASGSPTAIGGEGSVLYMRGIDGVPADADRDDGLLTR